MKQGDQVSTPNGVGVFFELNKIDEAKAYVRLKEPLDTKTWRPIVVPGHPVWECLPCNEFFIKDLKVTKTLEERESELQKIQMQARARQEAAMREQMRQFQEAQRKQYEQQNNQGKSQANS